MLGKWRVNHWKPEARRKDKSLASGEVKGRTPFCRGQSVGQLGRQFTRGSR
jgi:hypothetical protein